MRSLLAFLMGGTFCLLSAASPATALTFPFTEDFSTSVSNWKDNASLALTYESTGGADGGGFVSTDFSFEGLSAGPTLFRGQGNFDSSGDAFVGDWLTAGVGVVRAYVRHDAPTPIDYFVRIATPGNFPGVAIEQSVSVPAGAAWTLLQFDTSFSNPLLTPEAPPGQEAAFYAAALGNVGNVQFGVSLPDDLVDDPTAYTFDLDQVSIGVPEPTGILLVLGCLVGGLSTRSLRPRNR